MVIMEGPQSYSNSSGRRTGFKILTFFFLLILIIACSSSDNENNGEENLPPDPGEAGKATIEGVDIDDDGLRDDVQRFIYMNYSAEETRILVNYAKNIQDMIINSDNKEASVTIAQKMMLQLECMMSLDPEGAREKLKNVESLLVNTSERFREYIKANQHLSGETFLTSKVENLQDSCR